MTKPRKVATYPCYWCGEPTKNGRKFCNSDCRNAMTAEIAWEREPEEQPSAHPSEMWITEINRGLFTAIVRGWMAKKLLCS